MHHSTIQLNEIKKRADICINNFKQLKLFCFLNTSSLNALK